MAALDFVEWFVTERKLRGWTQEQLSQKIGYSRNWLIKVEKGKKDISKSFVIGVAYAFEVNVNQALNFAGEGDRPRSIPPDSTRPNDFSDLSQKQYEAIIAFRDLLKEKDYLADPRPKDMVNSFTS